MERCSDADDPRQDDNEFHDNEWTYADDIFSCALCDRYNNAHELDAVVLEARV